MQVEPSTTNVISCDFKAKSVSTENLDELASEIYNSLANELEDPIESLLNEFDDLVDSDFEFDDGEILSASDTESISFTDDPIAMSQTLLENLNLISDRVKKLNYYFDEMNLDT